MEQTHLADISPFSHSVGYGDLGVRGDLGYENQRARLSGAELPHCISTHAPSTVRFKLPPGFRRFDSQVGFSDDVASRDTHAHFLVFGDDRLLASAPLRHPQDGPTTISADISGCHELTLQTLTSRWAYCHSIWLDPRLSTSEPPPPLKTWDDPLHRARIDVPNPKPHSGRCIATVVSPGFEDLLHDLLWSLRTFGRCDEDLVVIFAVNPNPRCHQLAEAYGAQLITATPTATIGLSIKALLYAAASVIDAQWFLCIDADTLVLGPVSDVFAAAATAPPGRICVVREANSTSHDRLRSAVRHTYFGAESDIVRILGQIHNGEADYPLVINDGVFVGNREALLAVEQQIRRMPEGIRWMEEGNHHCWWRNQFIFNLALARLDCGWPMDNNFNVQLHTDDVLITTHTGAHFRGRPVRILHLCGVGKRKYVEWRHELRRKYARL